MWNDWHDMKMKARFAIALGCCSLAALFALSGARAAESPEKTPLDVLELKTVPDGVYEVRLQLDGAASTVTLALKNNRAAFVKSDAAKFEGLSGEFELIGNGVFMARLAGGSHRATQLWVFKPDGIALVKEVPDRGEKQVAQRVK
jgi:hypothetical protein